MLKRITHINVWVHDQDEALDFYTRKLGLEVREDVSLEEFAGYRWLTVGPPAQPDVCLILAVPGPPAIDAEAAERLLGMIAQGAHGGAGTLIFESDDIQATCADLKARGVEFIQEPMERPYGIDAAFRDPFGNPYRITQPVPAHA